MARSAGREGIPLTSAAAEGSLPPADRRVAVFVALGTLLLHGGLALWLPLPGLFDKYGLAAAQYVDGSLPGERLMDFSPLYFHLSVALTRWTSAPNLWLQGLQIVLAAGAVGLFYVLVRRRLARSWALLAAGALAFDPLLLVYERILEPEAILIFLLLAVMAWLPSLRHAGWTGCLAAACLAVRPTFLPIFLAVPLFYFWQRRRKGQDLVRVSEWMRPSALFLLPVIVTLGVLSVRAHQATGDWRSPMMNPGTVFFEGNQPLSRGTSAQYPPVVLNFIQHNQGRIPDSGHAYYRRVARAHLGDDASLRQVNAFWAGKATHFLRQEPALAAEKLLGKLLYAFHGFRWHDVTTAWAYEPTLPFPFIPYALVAALALFGTLFEARRWPDSLLFYLLMAVQLGVMVVFYVSARQRLPMLPAMIYFAVLALRHLGQAGRRRLLLIPMVLLLAFTLWLPDAAMRDEAYRRQGFQAAEGHFTAARDLAPGVDEHAIVEGFVYAPWALPTLFPTYVARHPQPLEARVLEALRQRQVPAAFEDAWRFDAARLAAEEAALDSEELLAPLLGRSSPLVYRGSRQSSDPGWIQAVRLLADGNEGRARQILQDALQRTPGEPFILAELAALGHPEARRLLLDTWSEADALYLMGQAQLRQGRFEDAVHSFTELLRMLPDLRDGRVLLAAALGRIERFDEGVEQYLQAAAQQSEPVLRPDDIVHLVTGWVEQAPQDPERLFYGAQILHRHGELETAYRWLQRVSPPPEVKAPWQQELSKLATRLEARSRSHAS